MFYYSWGDRTRDNLVVKGRVTQWEGLVAIVLRSLPAHNQYHYIESFYIILIIHILILKDVSGRIITIILVLYEIVSNEVNHKGSRYSIRDILYILRYIG